MTLTDRLLWNWCLQAERKSNATMININIAIDAVCEQRRRTMPQHIDLQ
jgi:hypothetical protein